MSSKFQLSVVRQQLFSNDIVLPLTRETVLGYFDSESEALDMMVQIDNNAVVNGEIRKPIGEGYGCYGPWKAFSIPQIPHDVVDLYTIIEIE